MYDHKAVIEAELEAGEELLWSAQPRQGIFLRSANKGFIPFSLIWGGFTLFWEYEVISSGAPFLFVLFGIPFVISGLYLMVGRFYFDAKLREKTFYGITNKRVIILGGIRNKQSKSFAFEEITDTEMMESPDGSGVISLAPEGIEYMSQSELVWPGQTEIIPLLSNIQNVRQPFEIIEQLRQRAAATIN